MVEIQYDEDYVLIGAIQSSYWELKEYVMYNITYNLYILSLNLSYDYPSWLGVYYIFGQWRIKNLHADHTKIVYYVKLHANHGTL